MGANARFVSEAITAASDGRSGLINSVILPV
jgi:hypothetical protein